MAFFFWPNDESDDNGERRIVTKGIEMILNKEEIETVLNSSGTPWDIFPTSERARYYEISCESNGLTSSDLTRAISLYRTVQMEQPGVQRKHVDGRFEKVPPLDKSDVLKSVFALKAEDIRSVCTGTVPQYTSCGVFDFKKAIVAFALFSITSVLFVLLEFFTCGKKSVKIPTDSSSWKEFLVYRGQIPRESGVLITLDENGSGGAVAIDFTKQSVT